MTVIIVSGILILLSILGLTVANKKYWDTMLILSIIIMLISIVVFLIGTLFYIPSHKESEIKYEQFVQERVSIEMMLENDRDVDRIALNELVIDYNNRVILAKNNSQRPIFKEYYSDDVDWMALETIDWR